MIINGKKITSKNTFEVRYPYTNEVVAKVPIAAKEDIVKAMKLSYDTKKNLKTQAENGAESRGNRALL